MDICIEVTEELAEALIDLAGAEQRPVFEGERGQWWFIDGRHTWATGEALIWALPIITEIFGETYPPPPTGLAETVGEEGDGRV